MLKVDKIQTACLNRNAEEKFGNLQLPNFLYLFTELWR